MEKLAESYIAASAGGPPLQGLIRKNAPTESARYERAVAVVEGQKQRGSGHVARRKAPSDFMTLHEIYLEFRTAGSAAATAVYETSRFAGGELSWAFSAGYAAGYLTHEYVCTSGTACDAAVGAATAAVVDYKSSPDSAPSGTQNGYADPTGGYQDSSSASEWGPGVGSDPGFGGGVHQTEGTSF
jgi:hypothetical protein